MPKIFFTSDQHFGDDRFNLFYRPFKTIAEQHTALIEAWNSVVSMNDIVYHVGDFAVTDEALDMILQLNGTIHLIKGNYDDPRTDGLLDKYFDSVSESIDIEIDGEKVHVNHYPEHAKKDCFNIVGHVHGLWKVQRNMVNVSCDAWHFKPVSLDEIKFSMRAIRKFYDSNVFAGELISNTSNDNLRPIYAEEDVHTEDYKVFLAGPTPRDKHTRSWRPDMLNALKHANFHGTVFLPEKRAKQDGFNYVEQVEWEERALDEADIIIFWVPRDLKKMPGFTTNIEFGEWMKSGKCVLGYPESAEKMKYMRHKAEQNGIPTYNDMIALAEHVRKLSTKK